MGAFEDFSKFPQWYRTTYICQEIEDELTATLYLHLALCKNARKRERFRLEGEIE